MDESIFQDHVSTCRSLRGPEQHVYYDTHVWPEVWRRFDARKPASAYRGLILVGTFQATTAALLIAGLNPKRIALLLTPETARFAQQVQDKLARINMLGSLRCPPEAWLTPAGDHSKGEQIYAGLRDVLNTWPDLPPEKIAVDLTGGKSTMTVALAKAAYVLRLPAVYINSDYDRNQPIEGTQRLETPPDPFEVFGDIERAHGWQLYQAHEYAKAAATFANLAERLKLAERAFQLDQASARLAEAYVAWDSFELRRAMGLLGQAADLFDTVTAEQPWARRVAERLRQQLTQLGPVAELLEVQRPQRGDGRAIDAFVPAQTRRLCQTPTAATLLGVCYTNALRRADQHKFDTAALMLYRCLELMSQHRLAIHGILTEYPRDGLRRLREGAYRELNQAYERTFRQVLKRSGSLDGKITLINGYVLLHTLGDTFARQCDVQQIEQQADTRNQSILAHGFNFVDRDSYQDFQALVDTIIGVWCTEEQVSWGAVRHTCTFLNATIAKGSTNDTA